MRALSPAVVLFVVLACVPAPRTEDAGAAADARAPLDARSTPDAAALDAPDVDAAIDAGADAAIAPGDGGRDAASPDASLSACGVGYAACGATCENTDPTGCGACAGLALCVDGACACAPGYADCGSGCESVSTDAHCGACGVSCPAGQRCTAGTCACAPHTRDCAGRCVDTATDAANCGACGHACSASEMCGHGACLPRSGGGCADTSSDPANCGTCGNVCASGYCSGGHCGPCPYPLCGGRCTDTARDPMNCGACGHACVSGSCVAGACAPCPIATCGAACVDTASDPANCGACGTRCASGATCDAGLCRSAPVDDLWIQPSFGAVRTWVLGTVMDGHAQIAFADDAAAFGGGFVAPFGPPSDVARMIAPPAPAVWLTRHGDLFRNAGRVTSGALDAADEHAVVTCDGRLLIDGTAVDGITDAVRVVSYASVYRVRTASDLLFEVSPIDYVAHPIAGGATYLEAGAAPVWVDTSHVLHTRLDAVPSARVGAAIFPNGTGDASGLCYVRTDDTTACTEWYGGTSHELEVALPTAVAHDVVEMVGGGQSIAGPDSFWVLARTASGELWSWDGRGTFTEPFALGVPVRVAGP